MGKYGFNKNEIRKTIVTMVDKDGFHREINVDSSDEIGFLPTPTVDGAALISVNGKWTQQPGYGYSSDDENVTIDPDLIPTQEIDPEDIQQSVSDWLDNHPEATTTVADGSITEAKLASAVAQKVNAVSTLSDEIDGLAKTTLRANCDSTWAKGSIASSNGTSQNSTTRIRTVLTPNAFLAVEANSGYKFAVYVYDAADAYQGIYNGKEYVKTTAWQTGFLNLANIPKNYKIRFLVATSDDASSIAASDNSNLFVYYPTDKTLTQEWKAADAKAVGDKFDQLLAQIDSNVLQYRQSYNTVVDLDTIVNAGTYQMANTNADSATYHRPTKNNLVLIVTATDTTRLAQLCIDVDRNVLYTRTRMNGTWTAWALAGEMTETHDIPENIGIFNIIRRAYQLTTIQYTPVVDLPAQMGDMTQGETYTGVPYSSTRVEQNFIPNAISLDTFMTAMKNPNSYIYTRISESHNSKTYYGSVCSSFVAYCYGIDDVIPTTISFSTYPGFTVLPDNAQNPQGLKLGDMLNRAGDHIAIITDILRGNRGEVKEFQIAESYMPRCRTRRYTPAQMQSTYFDTGYVAYRYENADQIDYTPSQWVSVFSESAVTPEWNQNIMPRRGDKANWRFGEDIVFDINNDANYTQYIVVDRETDEQAYSGNVSSVITLSNVPAGKYKICLTDGTNNSADAFFTVQNPSITYTADGNGNVDVSWTADDFGTASSILWVNNNSGSMDYNAVRGFHILTDAEKAAGTAKVTPPNMSTSEAPSGVWGIRMMYKTEFGLFASDISQIQVT